MSKEVEVTAVPESRDQGESREAGISACRSKYKSVSRWPERLSQNACASLSQISVSQFGVDPGMRIFERDPKEFQHVLCP